MNVRWRGLPAVIGRAKTPWVASHAWLLCLVALIASPPALPAPGEPSATVAVVYPAAASRYGSVFDDIIRGIKSKVGVELYPSKDGNEAALRQWLVRHDLRSAIALGRRPSNALTGLHWHGKKVVGAAYAPPGPAGAAGISLYLDPVRVARAVRHLNPNISRLITVVDADVAPWVTAYQERIRQALSMELEVIKGRSGSTQTARAYWAIAQKIKPGAEALWVNTDISNTLVDGLVEEAWRRNITLVSTNLAHVERGFLLALIPDTEKLGARLAELAVRAPKRQTIEPLMNTRSAINGRVANHLNLTIDPDDYDIVFE